MALDFDIATTCYGNDPSQFPSNNLFAAAGDGIWDNGASCGREYLVRCISASVAGSCKPGQTIQVKIVDYALSTPTPPSARGTTIVLSETAFGSIANSSATSINIEFQQV
ncbi:putative EG45-like domain containing protein 1 isoform X2 [Manihot esculenta]|uniref:putative EG45-like domain containing protein 1 isoform X2 n=1 Tax=Manihot esculenta TaxID=3983 RepID=UPI001CC76927|nr:putative EG45-like domain containing protein 1 isoform X2 [Manihot esculenta]